MSDAARLAKVSFSSKPEGVSYNFFTPTQADLSAVEAVINTAICDAAYAAIISYTEAIVGLQAGSTSWSIIRLYYSSFYSLRSTFLMNRVVPFNCKNEMILNVTDAKFLKGGSSSHHWNWRVLRSIPQLSQHWYLSKDSEDSYSQLRLHRENVNYTHSFTDPDFHRCLVSGEADLHKRFRFYRDDDKFFYTYLPDHLAISYPTKLLFEIDARFKASGMSLSEERIAHIKKIWSIKDRCPLT